MDRLKTLELRAEMFKAAHEYHAALAAYCRARATDRDIESPTQILLGKGLFYYIALSKLLAHESTQRLAERMSFLRSSQRLLARRYAQLKQPLPSSALPAP
jgi:hypothetical protein